MSEVSNPSSYSTEFDLGEFMSRVWQERWLLLGAVVIFAAAGAAYAFTAKEWFRAQILLVPTSADAAQGISGQLGGLSGLASLAGLGIGDGDSAEPMAVLRSRELTQEFISTRKLLPVLFADKWDANAGRWRSNDPEDWPDARDGVKYFNERIRTIQEDKKTGLVTISIEWRDPGQAAEWAGALVNRANAKLRARALTEAESNVKYLRQQLATETVVTLQQSIGRLLDRELQNLMLARGKEDFAFRVIDAAEVPKYHSRPNRGLIVASAVGAGAVFGFFLILVRTAFLSRPRLPSA